MNFVPVGSKINLKGFGIPLVGTFLPYNRTGLYYDELV